MEVIYLDAKELELKPDNTLNYWLVSPKDISLHNILLNRGVPILNLKGSIEKLKIRYVAIRDLKNSCNLKKSRLQYPMRKCNWIHPRETIPREEYNTQIKGITGLHPIKNGSDPIVVSVADAVQLLGAIQHEEESSKLIRELIIKLEAYQGKFNYHINNELIFYLQVLETLDIICYDWIRGHGKDLWHGYKMLWEDTLWQLIIDIHYRIRKIKELPNPEYENIGLHHKGRPYRKIYPNVATKGRIIDKRFSHEDPRQEKWI